VDFSRRIFKRTADGHGTDAPDSGGGDAAAPGAETSAAEGAAAPTVTQATAESSADAGAHTCPHCESPMADGQEWCTQCGERAGGSMRKRAGWTSAGALTAASAILASGAAAAGVAALNQSGVKEPPHRSLLAQTPATTATAPPAAPTTATPGTPETLKTPHTSAATAPLAASTTSVHTQSSSTSSATHSTESSSATESQQTSISTTTSSELPELQGLTASAYTLNAEYPKSALEGPENDPSRALEGRESGTAWTVTVKTGTAEHLNVGLSIALGGATRVGSVEVHTSTPGFPLEIYGSTANHPPATITEWTRLTLTPSLKASATLSLGSTGTHWRYVLLWIPKVPANLHHVALGEVALFPPA
jgi:hypothetical protein